MRHFAVLIALITWMISCSTCDAQFGNQSGGFGQRGVGQSSMGQGSFGQGSRGAFGSPVGRGQSRGGAGYGTSAFGTPGSGFGGGPGTGIGGLGQQAFGNQFGGGAVGDSFLGNDAAQMQNFFRALNRGRRAGAQLDFAIENLNEMRERRGQDGGRDNTPPVRVKFRPAFETPLGTMDRVRTDLERRLLANAADMGIADAKVSIEGSILILEGTVATQHERDLAEKMILLEPGVSGVDNRLTVEE